MIVQLINNPRRLFLVDGIGALLSAFSLGIILRRFAQFFGMPSEILIYLALAAVVLAIYSFSCHLIFPKNWKYFLRAIATANLLYALVTISLVFQYHGQLTFFGYLYFILELIIIVSLAGIEIKTSIQSYDS